MQNSLNNIKCMLSDLKSHQGRDRQQLFKYYVQKRLDKSVATYYEQLMSSYKAMTTCDGKRVLKKLTK